MVIAVTLIIAACTVIIDQLLKIWAVEVLYPAGGFISGIPGILNFVYLQNNGAAFGLFKDMRWLFIILAILFVGFIIYILIKKNITSKLFIVSVSLILGGTIGNSIDRVLNGYVIDFLSLTFFPPVCNFADYSLTVGTALLIIYVLFFSDFIINKEKNKK